MERSIERTSSIEFEPLTLKLEQLQYARETALCVLSTRTIEEAIEIFTEGLQRPVFCVKGEMEMEMEFEKGAERTEMLRDLRDIVTAPF
ncbi:hypothetical protein J5N97_012283 [Dioscorea zingiberensis]|uniref:Uncharacterized protein n=1 Tax=Dioscorea zingiberensis TaxID=325984 RepID=A0A9D5CPW8_9LILI|nr:hypothetical protein J5N97_012283 [Dioscorea zingiberensis]